MHHLMYKRIPKEDTCLGISIIEASQPNLLEQTRFIPYKSLIQFIPERNNELPHTNNIT